MCYENKRQKLISAFILCLILFSIFTLLIPTTVYAANGPDDLHHHVCEICGQEHDISSDKLTSFQRAVYEMNNVVYAAQILSQGQSSNGSGNINTTDVLKFDTSQGTFGDLWTAASSMYDVLKIIGTTMCLIYSMVEYLGSLSHRTMTLEHFALWSMKLVISLIVVLNGFDIITALVNLGTAMFNVLDIGNTTMKTDTTKCVYDLFTVAEGIPLVDALVGDILAFLQVFKLLIPWILLMVAKVIIAVACWARVLEIIVRVVFAPIGISDLFVYGTNSNGVSYLKKLFVAVMQGAVIAGMIQAYAVIVTNLTGFGNWMVTVIMAFTLIAAVTKAKNIASDICGV